MTCKHGETAIVCPICDAEDCAHYKRIAELEDELDMTLTTHVKLNDEYHKLLAENERLCTALKDVVDHAINNPDEYHSIERSTQAS